MTTILIVESNTPDLVVDGHSAAMPFVITLAGIDPGIDIRICAPYGGEVSSGVLDGVDGVVFSGSGVRWSTDDPEAAPLRAFMSRVFDWKIPSYGSCNGLQLAASVLGGSSGASPNGLEVGLASNLNLTEDGKTHPFMAGRNDGWAVPCVHRDEVQRIPDGAVVLAGNTHSPVQAMVYEQDGINFWGVQYHPELTAGNIAQYLRIRDGIFAEHAWKADDLDAASHDAQAAERVGTTPEGLAFDARSREFANWVNMIQRA